MLPETTDVEHGFSACHDVMSAVRQRSATRTTHLRFDTRNKSGILGDGEPKGYAEETMEDTNIDNAFFCVEWWELRIQKTEEAY